MFCLCLSLYLCPVLYKCNVFYKRFCIIVNVCIVYVCPVLYKCYMLDKIAYCVLCRQQFPLNDKSSHTIRSNLTKLLRNVP